MAVEDLHTIKCPSCGKSLKVRKEWAGRKAKCKYCQQSLVIPSLETIISAAPTPLASVNVLDVRLLRTSSESTLRIISLLVSIVIYLVCALSIIGIVYLGFFLLFSYFALASMMAQMRSNGIKIGPDQLPELYESARRASSALGLSKVPDVYVIQAGGVLNAFATKLAFRRYVVLYSDLVDACGKNSAELDMVIAHEIAKQ